MTAQDNARKLLQLLATDDDFRRKFEADPVGLLKAYGIEVDPSQVPPGGVRLPSKEQIARNLDTLSNELHATMGIIVFKA
ncbi:NHLP-related RiPP peptide [Vulcaniibacterium gelatinicum]|jgi:putative modified peptide|uniref:NHLP-related RiPP peptide n=1 Tax=Vulcaniibacterium gelatinicum TaxID=2598725 RepID=UPI0011CB7891|nr:NHLP-related RiPP peptide [Vulcaniibacterium gelatinicum]